MRSADTGRTTVIAGHEAELRAVDLRTYARRDDALGAESSHGAADSLDLLCVARLESLVDRDSLLRSADPAEPPYWALPWIGARVIAARMTAHPPYPTTYVLDLGCGLGLAGVAAGVAGAHVTFADNVAAALEFACANARLHGTRDHEIRLTDFTRDRLERRFDWILAADVVYDPADYAGLATFLDVHLNEHGTLLLTESLRADARSVIEMLAGRGIRGTCEAIWILEDGRAERTWLHVLTRA